MADPFGSHQRARPRISEAPQPSEPDARAPAHPSEDTIRALVLRLSRPHPSGGRVIERAAVLAAGADLEDVMVWIAAHDGQPETAPTKRTQHGLHGSRVEAASTPRRYVLPAGALD